MNSSRNSVACLALALCFPNSALPQDLKSPPRDRSKSGDVVFQDTFDLASRAKLSPNLVSESPPLGMGYSTNTPEGFLLKNWIVADVEPDGPRRSFWVIPKREDGTVETYAEQAGRSRNAICFANVPLPQDAQRYVVEFRQRANDNDHIGFVLGSSEPIMKHDGIELSYQRQLPGTDTTVQDIYYQSPWGRGVIAGEAKRLKWVHHRLEVDGHHVSWSQDGRVLLAGTVKSLLRGGYFGIRQSYERGSRYDDVHIKVLQRSPVLPAAQSPAGTHHLATVEDSVWNAFEQRPEMPPGYEVFALLPENTISLARLEWWKELPKNTPAKLRISVAINDNAKRTVFVSFAHSGKKIGQFKLTNARALQKIDVALTENDVRQAVREGVQLGLRGGEDPLWIVWKIDKPTPLQLSELPQLLFPNETREER